MKRLEVAEISKKNKSLIRGFQQYLAAKNCGQQRISKLTYQLRKVSYVLGKNLDKVTRKDLIEVTAHFNQLDTITAATKADYRRALKQFFKYYEDEDKRLDSKNKTIKINARKFYKYLQTQFSCRYKEKEIDPSSILTDEDIQLVVEKGCDNIRHKALIKFLHETGLRAGELLGLRRRDIVIKKNIGEAYVDGKTGKRLVQFTKSMSYIVQWLDIHPIKEENAFVWLTSSSNYKSKLLKHRSAAKLVDVCFKNAGVNKKHNLHWFRHSRASLNAPHWTETIMCKYFGWVIGSKQVRTYCHISPKQIEDAFLKMNGLSEEQEEKKNLPLLCGCGTTNDSFSRYCYRCGNPLTIQTAVQDQEVMKTETGLAIKEMMEMFRDPEMMKAFMEFKSQGKT